MYPPTLITATPPSCRSGSFLTPCAFTSLILLLLNSTLSFVSDCMAASFENSNVCSSLESQFPGQVSYPKDASYGASISSYFYQEARLAPQCIVFPKTTSDVSRIVKTISELRAKAAVRGGGHAPIANAANLDNAVTIDLSGMNTVSLGTADTLGPLSLQNDSDSSTGLPSSSAASNAPFVPNSSGSSNSDYSSSYLSSDATGEKIPLSTSRILSAGGGATWGDVYQNLEFTGLISIGGRGTSLGVGGLTTGGWLIPLACSSCRLLRLRH